MPTLKKGKIGGKRGRGLRGYTRRTRGPTKALKRWVNRAIARNVENKIVYYENVSQVATTEAPTVADVQDLSVVVGQGTQQNQRIGNNIKVKSHIVKVTVFQQGARSGASPTWYKIFIFSMKNHVSAPTLTELGYLLEAGAGTNGWNSALGSGEGMKNLGQGINKDLYKLIATRSFQLFNPFVAGTAVSAQNNSSGGGNYRCSRTVTFNITKRTKKRLYYNDTVTSTPTNDGIFMLVCSAQANGINWDATTYATPGLFNWTQTINYEDA